jgi:hypothetical protein
MAQIAFSTMAKYFCLNQNQKKIRQNEVHTEPERTILFLENFDET